MKEGKVFLKSRLFQKVSVFLMVVIMIFTLGACGNNPQETENMEVENKKDENATIASGTDENVEIANAVTAPPENFVLITGGTFEMGSPDTEAWRSEDEVRHTVTVSDFYMGIYEVTQAEYAEVTGENPSSFSGDDLPVEMVSWMDAVRYCNARSEKEGLTPAYTVEGQTVTWNCAADGYRLLFLRNMTFQEKLLFLSVPMAAGASGRA